MTVDKFIFSVLPFIVLTSGRKRKRSDMSVMVLMFYTAQVGRKILRN